MRFAGDKNTCAPASTYMQAVYGHNYKKELDALIKAGLNTRSDDYVIGSIFNKNGKNKVITLSPNAKEDKYITGQSRDEDLKLTKAYNKRKSPIIMNKLKRQKAHALKVLPKWLLDNFTETQKLSDTPVEIVSVDKNGRIYTNIINNKQKRRRIKLGGEWLAEVDVKGCFPTLLPEYLKAKGLRKASMELEKFLSRNEDFYDAFHWELSKKELIELEKDKELTIRIIKKQRFNSWLNDRRNHSKIETELIKCGLPLFVSAIRKLKRTTSIGNDLMHDEQKIMYQVYEILGKDNVPFLFEHDGVACRASDTVKVKKAMIKVLRDNLHYYDETIIRVSIDYLEPKIIKQYTIVSKTLDTKTVRCDDERTTGQITKDLGKQLGYVYG